MWKLAEDTISTTEIDNLADWLRGHPKLTQGDLVREFEGAWSAWLGVHDSVMMSSGTAANFALVAAVGRRLGRTPRIGVSAVTWATNVTPALLLRYPVTVFDVDPQTLALDEEAVCEAMDAGAIDVLFVTHLLGLNGLTARIVDTARSAGLTLIEDCCEAHGARFEGQRVGTVGAGGTFSFYFGHHMSTIEGGIVSTDDAELADDLRLLRAHGLARESGRSAEYAARHPDVDPRFLFVLPGLNFRSTELNAFLGLSQLSLLDARIEHRNRNLERFLQHAPAWLWSDFHTRGASSFALPLIATDAASARRVHDVIQNLGIESRPVVAGNLLRQPFLSSNDVTVWGGRADVADHIHQYGSYVGNGHHVSTAMVDSLLQALAEER
jgi:CDP-4-dehydro-6-deoxyglucose reductase, E1